MNTGDVLAVILPLLTLWWAHGVYRHFVRPPKDGDYDWAATHGMYLGIGTCLVGGLWFACWRLVVSTIGHWV